MKFLVTIFFLFPSISFADQLGNYTNNLQFVFHANEGIGNVLYDYSPNKSSAIIQNSGHVWETGKSGFQINNNITSNISISSSLVVKIHSNLAFTFFIRFKINTLVGASGNYNAIASAKTTVDNKWSFGYRPNGNVVVGYSVNCTASVFDETDRDFFTAGQYYDVFITYINQYMAMYGRKPFDNNWNNREWRLLEDRAAATMCNTNPKAFIIPAWDSSANNAADISMDEIAYWDVNLSTSTMRSYAENLTNKSKSISE